MTILVDIDDTIENLCECWCAFLNEKYGTAVLAEDIQDWDISKYFPNVPKDELFAPLYEESFWTTVTPKLDAIKYLFALYEEGFDIYLCSASDYRSIKTKYEQIVIRYFPFIGWDKIIICSGKQMIKGDILIDDGVHNLAGGSYHKILFTAPHNKMIDAEKYNMYRADDWEAVYKIVHSIAGGQHSKK